MFDTPLNYQFVQRNNKIFDHQDFEFEYIYKFFIRNKTCRRKIIVQVKQYSTQIFRVDFYATVSAKDREIRNFDSSKYRYTTKVGKANRVAATIFGILGDIRRRYPDMNFAFQAATMIGEENDDSNKRFKSYREIISRVVSAENSIWKAFEFEKNSYIFVIQKRLLHNKRFIFDEYGKIFSKTFETEEGS